MTNVKRHRFSITDMSNKIIDSKNKQHEARTKAAILPSLAVAEHDLVKLPQPHLNELKAFLSGIGKSNFVERPIEIYLFGSMARGQGNQSSDLDLAVVCDAFAGVPWTKRVEDLCRLAGKYLLIRPLGLTFLEFKLHDYPGVIGTIRRRNVKIAWTEPGMGG